MPTPAKNPVPQRAIILAAGYGTRMQPLTLQRPKPLLPFCGKPLLEHAIDLLASFGVKQICINAHYKGDQIMKWVVDHPRDDVQLNLSYEPELLGTGGPLKRMQWFIRGEEPFWLFNADVVAQCDPAPLLKAYAKTQPVAAWWMTDQAGPRSVEVESGCVTNMASKRPGTEGTMTFTGLHLIHPRLLDYIEGENFLSIITAYRKAMEDGETLAGVECPGSFWADVGTPGEFLAAQMKVSQASSLWNAVHHRLEACDTLPPKGGTPTKVILGEGTKLWGPVSHVAMPATASLTPQELKALEKIGIHTGDACAEFLPPRPSERDLIRVQRGKQSAILIRYNPERTENTLFVPLSRRLHKAGIQVPAVLADYPRDRFSLVQDLGRLDLKAAIQEATPTRVKKLYQQALDQALLLHQKALKHCRGISLQPGFDAALYRWERNYFSTHFLDAERGWSAPRRARFQRAAAGLAKTLLSGPQTLIHRDLQSSNVLVHERSCWLIDYQGLRLGSPAYDLASLLLDPYVCLPEQLQLELLDYYMEQSGGLVDPPLFWQAGCQRLLQALGAYGRLGRIPATASFRAHLQPGLAMLNRAVKNLNNHADFCALVHDFDPDYNRDTPPDTI